MLTVACLSNAAQPRTLRKAYVSVKHMVSTCSCPAGYQQKNFINISSTELKPLHKKKKIFLDTQER